MKPPESPFLRMILREFGPAMALLVAIGVALLIYALVTPMIGGRNDRVMVTIVKMTLETPPEAPWSESRTRLLVRFKDASTWAMTVPAFRVRTCVEGQRIVLQPVPTAGAPRWELFTASCVGDRSAPDDLGT